MSEQAANSSTDGATTVAAGPIPNWKSRFALPKQARSGEQIQVKTLLAHPMESGFRRDFQGEAIPRDIITRFECDYLGETVFAADLFPAIAANPYLAFHLIARSTGPVTCRWIDQRGESVTVTKTLQVAPR